MRKRFVTTLIIGILTFACAFGFTACGEGETPETDNPSGGLTETAKGLSAEELKQAIQATLNAQNAKLHMAQFDSEKYDVNANWYYDDEKGICKCEDLVNQNDSYFIMVDNNVWGCYIEYEKWHFDKMEMGYSIKDLISLDIPMSMCVFKVKDDDSAQFISFEETYASFKYNSETDTYSSTLLAIDSYAGDFATEMELEVSLTVDNGYVTKFEFTYEYDTVAMYMTFTYSDFGAVEVTVPEDLMTAIKEKE